MTERQIADKVLRLLYDRKDEEYINFVDLCEENNFVIENLNQRQRILDSLFDKGYVEGQRFIAGNAWFGITHKGIAAVEDALAKSLVETDSLVRSGKFELDINDNSQQESNTNSTSSAYEKANIDQFTPKEINQSMIDSSVSPCFGVEKLAKVFVGQIKSLCSDEKNENICMLGIFAPWGRGKTFLFKEVRKILEAKANKKYSVVQFNAWKYQETPAIWAYMYETLRKELGKKMRYKIWRFGVDLIRGFKEHLLGFVFGFAVLSGIFWIGEDAIRHNSYAGLGFFVLIVAYIWKHYLSTSAVVFKTILKRTKTKSFGSHLGLQNEVESEIELLLRFHTGFWCFKKRVVLYVDDIDRCPHEKMVHIIDSLRTVLENSEIKKRLVVVCSVDPNKLKSALKIKYKGLIETNSSDALNKMVREQFDKLFLSSIGLPTLSMEQKIEFLNELADNENEEEKSKNSSSSIMKRDSTWSPEITNEEFSTPKEFSTSVLSEKIIKLIGDSNHELTPRQLRIIYYRMILANNILSSGAPEEVFREELLESIVERSIAQYNESDKDYKYKEIVDMVVPY